MHIYSFWANIYNTAKAMFYDNSSSGLTAKNVQDAIDEIVATSGGKPFATTLVDPALNSITQAMMDDNSGVVITLTGAGNDQTLPAPTDTTAGNTKFTVINNDSSTDPINIIGGAISVSVLDPGKKVQAIWEGTVYAFSEAEGIFLDDGSDIKMQNSTRNFNVQSGKFKAGSNTEISEVAGDTLIENTSATNDIIEKLGDDAGATNKITKNSADVTVQKISSDGTVENGIVTEDGIVEVPDSTGTVQERLSSIGANYSKGLSRQVTSETVDDEAFIDLENSIAGFGFVQVGDNEEWTQFSFTSAGVVTLIQNTANVVSTDTNDKFCIFDNGTSVRVKNRLGTAKTVRLKIEYSA